MKLTLRKLRLDKDGYLRGRFYCGHGLPMYWCGSDNGAVDTYFRARDRKAAKEYIRKFIAPAGRFYN